MLVENYSNSRSLQTQSAAKAIFSDLRVNVFTKRFSKRHPSREPLAGISFCVALDALFGATLVIQILAATDMCSEKVSTALIS